MSFGGGGGGGGSINTASDAFISTITDGDLLQYNGSTAKWNNLSLEERVQDVVGATLVAGSNTTVNYNDAAGTVTISATGGGASPTYANLPAGTTLTVTKSGGTWPARPTSRNDIVVQWKGPDPSPSIVSSGTGGMLDNVDMRFITP